MGEITEIEIETEITGTTIDTIVQDDRVAGREVPIDIDLMVDMTIGKKIMQTGEKKGGEEGSIMTIETIAERGEKERGLKGLRMLKEPGTEDTDYDTVLFEYRDFGETEIRIQQVLDSLNASIENIRLIRDRKTGLSRRFAFVKFTSVEHARQFIEANQPFITIDNLRVKVEYSNSSSVEDEGWACKNVSAVSHPLIDDPILVTFVMSIVTEEIVRKKISKYKIQRNQVMK
ncbi:8013_t:CDS:2 [Paraglomus brasilianum]|uniref:8013_t:CDS:1 n=1 Tax=Paraglomus brasilianum TaxID=144538 RepID=A0A9N9FY02_9GLOM|nr:8013_t:CDS:2 [Paraglomus brasilianum]